jgi:chaperonin GroES
MENTSGYHPIEDRVLVKVSPMEEKTAGGIVIAQATKDAEDMAQMHGEFVTGGEEALARLSKHAINPGDTVLFAKYAGQVYRGKDGEPYRIMNTGDVVAKADGIYGNVFNARSPMKPAAI